MADLRYPNEVFRFANVRAPQKYLEADYPSRYVDYSFVDQDILDNLDLEFQRRTDKNRSRTHTYSFIGCQRNSLN